MIAACDGEHGGVRYCEGAHADRRFYFAGGVVERHCADPGEPVWLLLEKDAFDIAFVAFDRHSTAPYKPLRRIFFRRRDYWYPAGFVGPLRDADYHEEARR